MKKANRFLSIILSLLFLFGMLTSALIPAAAATDKDSVSGIEEDLVAPVFDIKTVIKDNTLKMTVNLTSGWFNALDAQFKMYGDVSCSSIRIGSALKNLRNELEENGNVISFAVNPNTRKISAAMSGGQYNYTGDFFEATFSFDETEKFSVTFEVQNCIQSVDKDTIYKVTPVINNGTFSYSPIYTISYNANGGSGAPAAQTKTHDVALTLSATVPVREGYTFKGWATSASGAVQYQPGAKYTANAAVTLYAVWAPNTYTITYNANGGSGAPAAQTKTHDVALTLSATVPVREGYTFKGWATSASGAVQYQPKAQYTANAAVTLYAVWTLDTYIVSYNANGGTGAPAQQTKTNDVTLILSSTVPVREGYTFNGWSVSANGTAQYQPGATYTANAAVTLYAVWTPDTYIVSYNANGGTGAPAAQIKTHDSALTLSLTVPVREGYTFNGWAISSNGAAQYQPGATYTANAAVTLYAVWTPDTYIVSYNANGGSGAPAAQIKTHDSALILSSTVPVREGYIFKGWAISSNGAAQYQPGATYTANAAVTLYAVWSIISYNIEISVSDVTINYMETTTLKPDITADPGVKYSVKYESSNPSVATVDKDGKVYGAKKGTATITCTVTDENNNTVTDTCKVTVKYSGLQWFIIIVLFGWIWYIK